jgi:hypothetical protein
VMRFFAVSWIGRSSFVMAAVHIAHWTCVRLIA